MLSISKPLSAKSAEAYYEKDDYYLKHIGQWQGKGSQTLGLSGHINKNDFNQLLRGYSPDSEKLVANAGKVTKDGQEAHRAGIDLTFSASKSVSLLSFQDPRVGEAFENAVSGTLEHLEGQYAQTRVHHSDDTIEPVPTGNMVFAKFNHHVSRALDPQLHTHVVAMNLTQDPTGKWKSLHNDKLFQNKMYLGQHFRAELAVGMRKLGYEIEVTDRSKGFFEIKGVDPELLETFSKRRQDVETRMDFFKNNPDDLQQALALHKPGQSVGDTLNCEPKLAEIAGLTSRKYKKKVSLESVRDVIKEECREHGTSLREIQAKAELAGKKQREKPQAVAREHLSRALESALETQSCFTRESILESSMKLGLGHYKRDHFDKEFQHMAKSKDILYLGDRVSIAGQTPIYSTKKMIELERQVIDLARNTRDKCSIRVGEDQADQFVAQTHQTLLEKAPERGGLTQGQKGAIKHIACTQDQFSVIQGDAGTGKSFSMNFARQILEKAGYKVRGFAPTGKAQVELNQSAEIQDCRTVDSFLASFRNTAKADRTKLFDRGKECWIVDETGMSGSRKVNEFMQAAKEAQAKVVFVGDRRQFAAIEAGRIFAELQDKAGVQVTLMQDVMRQQAEQAKEIVACIKENKITRAFDVLDGDRLSSKEKREMGYKDATRRGPTARYQDALDRHENLERWQERMKAVNHALAKGVPRAELVLSDFEKSVLDKSPERASVGKNKTVPQFSATMISAASKELKELRSTLKDLGPLVDPAALEKDDSKRLQRTNCINHVEDRDQRLDAVVKDYLGARAKHQDVMVITGANQDRNELNGRVRQHLVDQGVVTQGKDYKVLSSHNLSGHLCRMADSYQKGQVVFLNRSIRDIKSGTQCVINDVDRQSNLLKLRVWDKDQGKYKTKELDAGRYGHNLSAFNVQERQVGVGERVVFLKNDKKLGVQNGQIATVKSIDDRGNVSAVLGKTGTGKEVTFNLNNRGDRAYNYLDHAYALTEYKSQGATVDKLVWHAATRMHNSFNSFYVAMTRTKEQVAVYTDDVERLRDQSKEEQHKFSTLDKSELKHQEVRDPPHHHYQAPEELDQAKDAELTPTREHGMPSMAVLANLVQPEKSKTRDQSKGRGIERSM